VTAIPDTLETPLSPADLARRWRAMCADPLFEDIPGKIELTEWGEILMSPVGKRHGLAAMRVAEALRQALPAGQTMAEVGIATSIGVRAPDIAWCSTQYLASHPEDMPLTGAPEICVEIASVSNALPKLREKARAYVTAWAIEAWLVFIHDRRIEIYDRDGQREASSFPVDLTAVFQS